MFHAAVEYILVCTYNTYKLCSQVTRPMQLPPLNYVIESPFPIWIEKYVKKTNKNDACILSLLKVDDWFFVNFVNMNKRPSFNIPKSQLDLSYPFILTEGYVQVQIRWKHQWKQTSKLFRTCRLVRISPLLRHGNGYFQVHGGRTLCFTRNI